MRGERLVGQRLDKGLEGHLKMVSSPMAGHARWASPVSEQERQVALCPHEGQVYSAREFAASHLDLLGNRESALLNSGMAWLESESGLLGDSATCFARFDDVSSGRGMLEGAIRSGERSAYLPNRRLKIKGCRPGHENRTFPMDVLDLDEAAICRQEIPFGVMTAEAVMRELVGYCFMNKHKLPCQARPLQVWEYTGGGECLGFALVSEVDSDDRVEALLEGTAGSLAEAKDSAEGIAQSGSGLIVGTEVRLLGLNLWSYVDQKSRALSQMHYLGAFRGVLNSNIGNDVVEQDDRVGKKLSLADFDTFELVEVPVDANPEEMDRFVLRCLVEVILGSLPILQYVDVSPEADLGDRADLLGAVYFTKSSFWRAYQRRFFAIASGMGWSPEKVEESLERMRRTQAAVEVLETRLLTAQSLTRGLSEQAIYFPHN